MAADKQALCDWLGSFATTLVVDALDAENIAARLDVAPALSADDFAMESLSIMRVVAESVSSASGFDTLRSGQFEDAETANAASVLLAVGLAIAGGRADWISRPQARAGRDRIASAGDAALTAVSVMGADGVDLYVWLSALTNVAVRLVSDQAADAVPVVRVETGISLPSTFLAYQLYGDAGRAESLVEIAGVSTPMLMPSAFNALEK
ncbi:MULTISPECIES: hypothetical protein [unclassified Agrobacterium]|uniref:hypothetical protein n=1 Tax=unclassified Agrobacterium TaxID=2632611 RepID=UPI0024483651|nr:MULTISPECIES: hypothetical protein [unclassified Agrobacterium]MDH0615931.1 hypothetical protein [Agrobacterium sp. GD03872]MDH0698046.1 hypothetical protein [Agrobacterium sp. GD03871]MDH1061131.1 hypothetical protein [Agrobacterium sp. GD03992]MDH2211837.1 hypothetical protein [Agrobacterium sp. GD03643]MDH2221229.1 hypothetical protein [Agrobacterium sp. GD03638]